MQSSLPSFNNINDMQYYNGSPFNAGSQYSGESDAVQYTCTAVQSADEIFSNPSAVHPSVATGNLQISLPSPTLPKTQPKRHKSSSPMRNTSARRRSSPHIPRPPNAFILFRSDVVLALSQPNTQSNQFGAALSTAHDDAGMAGKRQPSLSKLAGSLWRALPKDQKEMYKDRAQDELDAHKARYPDYRYRPRARRVHSVGDTPVHSAPAGASELAAAGVDEVQDQEQHSVPTPEAQIPASIAEVEQLFSTSTLDAPVEYEYASSPAWFALDNPPIPKAETFYTYPGNPYVVTAAPFHFMRRSNNFAMESLELKDSGYINFDLGTARNWY